MIKKIAFIATIITTFAGLYFGYTQSQKPPSVGEIKQNPALFVPSDYKDKIALHTRLSTIFPRGQDQNDVFDFFKKANIAKTDETFFECTHKVDFGNISFIFKFPDKTIEAIQVDGWPSFRELCKDVRLTPQDEKPTVLPLMPLPK